MLAIKLQLQKIKKDLYFVKGCFHDVHIMLDLSFLHMCYWPLVTMPIEK